jgi:hypothetical protein
MLRSPETHALVVSQGSALGHGRAYIVNDGDEGVAIGPAGLAGVGGEPDFVATSCKNGSEFEDWGYIGLKGR